MEEKSVFLETLGDTPILRVIDFLIVNDDFDYTMTEIAKHSKVGYSTLKLFIKNLEEKNIVVKTRTVGKAKLYKLNSKNTVVKKLKELYWDITKK